MGKSKYWILKLICYIAFSRIEEQKRELFRFLRKQIDGAKSQINYEEEHNEDFVEAYLRKKFQREQKNDFDSYW